ncbi:MAG: HyaD/HybD family hydrogenase maturation endopeptidase [Acidobacteriota bacterium]
MDRKPILILGVGNTIQMDDGIGVRVVEEMKNNQLPENVELFDGGTLGYDLLGVIEGRKKIIVIDAVKGQQSPGTLYKFSPDDVPSENNYDSLHQLGIIEAIRLAYLQNKAPEKTVIIGVEPEVIDWGLSLTGTIKAKIPRIIDLVIDEIELTEKTISPNISNN